MLHILWVILKIAGIIILSIILLLLILAVCILLVPVRYTVSARKDSEIFADVRASWFFHIVYFRYIYENNSQRTIIRVLGVRLDKARELVNKIKAFFVSRKKTKVKNKHKNKDETKAFIKEQSKIKTTNTDDEPDKIKENTVEKSNKVINISEPEAVREIEEKPEDSKWDKLKTKIKSIINKLISIINKIKAVPSKAKQFFKKLKLTSIEICDKIKNIREFINDEGNRAAFSLILEQALVIVRHIKPRKYKGYIRFGTGDPASTGQILGICGVLIPLYRDNIKIVPDFEEVVFEGNIFLKGRITVIKFALVALKLYRDKNIKRLIKQNGGNYVNR